MRAKRPGLWALGVAAVTLLLRLPFVRMPFDPADEGYYAAVAQSTVRGSRLYADLWYVRPPFLNFVYAWSYRFSLGTRFSYDVSVRLLAAVFAAATVGVLAWLLFEEFSLPAALLGSAMAALMAASLALQNEANAETWMMLPYTLSAVLVLYVALRELPSRRALWIMALAGVLTGIAAGFKQVALVNLALPVVAWAAFDRGHFRRWLARTAAFAAGVLGVWACILVDLGVTDDVRAFLYYAWARNAMYIRATQAGNYSMRLLVESLGGPLAALTLTAVAVLALFVIALLRDQRWSQAIRIALYALAWLLVSAIAIAASGRFYQHYFIQATMPLALLFAASADALLSSGKRTWSPAVAVVLIAVVGLLSPVLSWAADLRTAGSVAADRQVYKHLAEQDVPRLTRPGGSVLVWGIDVGVRAYSPLRSASRLPVVAYDYGWTPTDRGRLLGEEFPSTADVVLAEFRQAPPDTIVLTGPLHPRRATSPHNDGVRLMDSLYMLVVDHYDIVERGTGYVVLKRRD